MLTPTSRKKKTHQFGFSMNKYITQKFGNLKLNNEATYSPLQDDAEISKCDSTPKPLTPIRNNCTVFAGGRKLFQNNNKAFKLNKRHRDKNKKTRLRNLFQELQNKIQSLKEDICTGLQNYQRENKTPNCITPNHKIRRILGRTPTKLYSPFSIETPPPSFHWRRELPDKLETTPISLKEWLI